MCHVLTIQTMKKDAIIIIKNLRTHYVSLTKFINIPQPKPLDLK